jgi:hypothetical protein
MQSSDNYFKLLQDLPQLYFELRVVIFGMFLATSIIVLPDHVADNQIKRTAF